MKILYITNADINDCTFGGGKGGRSRYELICKIGKTDLQIIKKKSAVSSAVSVLQGFYPPLTKKSIVEAVKKCRKRNYDMVFLDTSVYGGLAKALKEEFPEIPVFAMFQNCELDYNAVRFHGERSLKSRIYRMLVKKSELLTLRYCDRCAVLSKRDARLLKKRYGVKTDCILPLFLKDEVRKEDLESYKGSDAYCLLFGPNIPPNTRGVKWFLKNVSPYIKIRTLVAGNGMDDLACELKQDYAEVTGYVKDIHELYKKAYCVCLPQFSGGGMKVKTIEAMMFGKTVFGTQEAFSGYGNDHQRAGALCNTSDEFITAINSFVQSGAGTVNMRSRKLYEEKYSEKAAFGSMRGVLEEITGKLSYTRSL